MMIDYTTKSPVLFLIFNRPDTTQTVFTAIRNARPAKLYIAADGPRIDRAEETHLCQQSRAIVEKIDWDCEVKTLFREENLGCKNAISSAIDWFFENEEEGIILEDDCLPSNSFFYFCDTSLYQYRYDTRIRHIAGCNLHIDKTWGTDTTYFANQTHVWGWASWRRVWKDYDKDLKNYQEDEVRHQLSNIFSDPFVLDTWVEIFKNVKSGKIDTWDYQLAFINYFNNSLSINSNINLISNIGFGERATHTFDANHQYANIPLGEISEITFPKYILPKKEADYAMFVRDFDLPRRWRKHNSLKRRIKRWLKNPFNASQKQL